MSKGHTTEECTVAYTIISASEGVRPWPKTTDFGIRSVFSSFRTDKQAIASVGKLLEKAIHFITYKQKLYKYKVKLNFQKE